MTLFSFKSALKHKAIYKAERPASASCQTTNILGLVELVLTVAKVS